MGAGKKSGVGAEKGTAKPQKTPEELKALEQFDSITEAASALMDAGEMDIYSAVREQLQRAADAFKDDDDMFADADEDNIKFCCSFLCMSVHGCGGHSRLCKSQLTECILLCALTEAEA